MVLLNQSKLFKLSQSPRQTAGDLSEEKRTLMNDLFTDVTAVPSIVIDSNNNRQYSMLIYLISRYDMCVV